MNAFQEASEIEAEGIEDVLRFLRGKAKQGQIVQTDKGSLSYELQTMAGDLLFNDKQGRLITVEVKIEQRHTGNLFIEDWSNLDSNRPKPGWIATLWCDYIAYYFLSSKQLYILNRPALFDWLYIRDNARRLETRVQQKYKQRNQTRGLLAPLSKIRQYDEAAKGADRKPIIALSIDLGEVQHEVR